MPALYDDDDDDDGGCGGNGCYAVEGEGAAAVAGRQIPITHRKARQNYSKLTCFDDIQILYRRMSKLPPSTKM